MSSLTKAPEPRLDIPPRFRPSGIAVRASGSTGVVRRVACERHWL